MGRWGKTLMWERNMDRLPPVHTLTRNRTCSILVYRWMLQPTEPPATGPELEDAPFFVACTVSGSMTEESL